MKRITIIFISFVSMLSITSCDFLDKEPHSLVLEYYFNNDAELQSFLTGVYSPLMHERYYGSSYALYNGGGDDLTFYGRPSSNSGGSILCANANSGNAHIAAYWRLLYEGVNRANMLLERADNNPNLTDSLANKAMAEAKCLRAFYYFHLVQGWGDVPFRLQSTKTVIGLDAERTSKEIIYNQIVTDMKDAIAYLPNSTAVPHTEFLTKSAVQGLLARVYLFRAGECYRDNQAPNETLRRECFTQAKEWALKVKDSNIHGLVKPYSRVFIDLSEDAYNSTGVRESIWEAAMAGNRGTPEQAAGRLGNELGLSRMDFSSLESVKDLGGIANPGYGYNFGVATLKLYNMYEEEGDTARGDWSIANYAYIQTSAGVTGKRFYYGKLRPEYVAPDGYIYTEESEATSANNKTRIAAKYRREYEKVLPKNRNYTPINFPILRYSDVLLMIAEADNELTATPSDLAYECIDEVRERAGLTPLQGSGLTTEQFRNAIKKERAMELCFEGVRRWDLIRWGDFYLAMREMEGYIYQTGWSASHTYAVDYYRISPAYNYFPIPDAEMSLNKQITANNPGW